MVVQHLGGYGIQGVLGVLLYLDKNEGNNGGTVLGGTWYSGGAVLGVLLHLNKNEGKNGGTVFGGTWYSGGIGVFTVFE